MFYTLYKSPLGNMTLLSNGLQLCGLWFDGQKNTDRQQGEEHEEMCQLPVFQETKRWLDIYFGGGKPDFTPPLYIQDTSFRQRVWEILLTIPYGDTMTYGTIAKIMAKERGVLVISAQAVGGAVGHNPIALVIPCHRVVGRNGCLTGYAAGLDKKMLLLQLEQEQIIL